MENSEILLKIIDERVNKNLLNSNVPTKIVGNIISVNEDNSKAVVKIAGYNTELELCNKCSENLIKGDNVFIELIHGDLSNAFISEKFGYTDISRKSYIYNFSQSNEGSGYINFAQLKILKAWANKLIKFEISRRGDSISTFIYVKFENINSTDPSLASFNIEGNVETNIYINKTESGVWDLYIERSEQYDSIDILDIKSGKYNIDHIEITLKNVFVSELPQGFIKPTNTMRVENIYFFSNTGRIYWKELGYGDKFAILPEFNGVDDDNKLKIMGAVGGAGTNPSLYDLITVSAKNGNTYIKGNITANNLNTAATKNVKTLTSASDIGWTNQTDGDASVVSKAAIAFWNGAYDGNHNSNLQYCKNGEIAYKDANGAISAKNFIKNATYGNFYFPEVLYGSVDITPSASNTPTSKSVTFIRKFSGVPNIQVTPNTAVPRNYAFGDII